MDLIFKRYSSPFLFLENLIENKKFEKGIITIWNQANDDKLWDLYLHSMSEKSFDEWKSEVSGQNEQNEQDRTDIETAKEDARNILNHFKPT